MTAPIRLVIPAAGQGTRLGQTEPKALVLIAGVPLLIRTLTVFEAVQLARSAVVLYPPGSLCEFEAALDAAFPGHSIRLAEGGAERQDSVRIGLSHLDASTNLVVLHDAARPFVSPTIVEAAIEAATEYGGATAAIPAVDTILERSDDGMLAGTPDRRRLWACQTPQVFQLARFLEAHERARAEGRAFTDDATLFTAYGGTVKIVRGAAENRKITTNEDLRFAEFRFGGPKQR